MGTLNRTQNFAGVIFPGETKRLPNGVEVKNNSNFTLRFTLKAELMNVPVDLRPPASYKPPQKK